MSLAIQCPSFPSDPNCANYAVGDTAINALIATLCTQMAGMPGCSIQKTCKTCSPFSIYSQICTEMPNMQSCSTFGKMCGPESAVAQCFPPPPYLPSSRECTRQIYSICQSMDMPGCDLCNIEAPNSTYSDCDLLATYSKLCRSMPGMNQCEAFSKMCVGNPANEYCSQQQDGANFAPAMKMFFHFGFSDYVLFEHIVPRNGYQYIAACLLCFAVAVIYEGLIVWARNLERNLKSQLRNRTLATPMNLGSAEPLIVASILDPPPTFLEHAGLKYIGTGGFKIALFRGVTKVILSTISYSLMLVTMTFNIGLFLSVVLGLGFGMFWFSGIYTEVADYQTCCE